MNGTGKEDQRPASGVREKERIETQIHRRRKVKAFSPLESEWESSQGGPASCGLTNKANEIRPLMPDRELHQESNRSTYYPLVDDHT